MSELVHLAIDAMGGDLGPRPVVRASLALLNTLPSVQISLVGKASMLDALIDTSLPQDVLSRISIEQADDVVSMSDKPGAALRHKRTSSMWRALELVRDGIADGAVSAGNTGALMAMSRHLVGTAAGISRPAICKQVPTAQGASYLLDLGANLNCTPQQLLQFAVMGSALAKVNGCSQPRVALLNVGAETTKGVDDIKSAATLLGESPDFEFSGFIEGHSLYNGDVDVIVCDGFVGNVALKVSEGVAGFVFSSLKERLESNFYTCLIALIAAPVLKPWAERFNPAKYNGAAFLGLNKTVVKSHGGADELGFQRAIQTAVDHIDARIPERLSECLSLP